MRRLTFKELQQTELDILIAFDRVCREQGIKYSIGCGTLLGAVRHKGFIPWDDDVDILMLREEYEKFKNVVRKNDYIIDGKYKVMMPGDEGYPYAFMKIIDTDTVLYEKNMVRDELGVWIDIFQVDYCAQKSSEAVKIANTQRRLFVNYNRARYRCKNDSIYNILRNIFWLPFFRMFTGKMRKQMLKNEQMFSQNPKMRYAGTMTCVLSMKDVYPSEYFDGYTEILFENHKFMAFQRYDDLLTYAYGDYMKLPPESERVSHDPEAYLKEY